MKEIVLSACIHVMFTDSDTEFDKAYQKLRKKFKLKLDKIESKKDSRGSFISVDSEEGVVYYFLKFQKQPTIGIIIHECFHANSRLLRFFLE